MPELTLLRSGNSLADPREQLALLASDRTPKFVYVLETHGIGPLRAKTIETLQVNVGRMCNQVCSHCHVDAGPDRRESMNADVADACLSVLRRAQIGTLDVTGGAPEMNSNFRRLVVGARELGCRVIDRCNLTILVAPGFEDLADFLAQYQVEVVASLPCYLEENVDKQRGERVFQRSIEALRRLNSLGYGMPDSNLKLTLVFNPTGYSLPPEQCELESAYRRELRARHAVEFTRLITITNMPISRFLADLWRNGKYDVYMERLVNAFNPATVQGLMCRSLISVDWRGNLFDCDFNQMLDLGVSCGGGLNVCDLDDVKLNWLRGRMIVTNQHCFGCTAGAGSSCSGSLT